MAISIYGAWGFNRDLISDYFDGDSDQFDPCFSAFKRIDEICDYGHESYFTDNLKLIDILSIKINSLRITKVHFDDLIEFYKDKDPKLMIESLYLNYDFESNLSIEEIELINKFSPKKLIINWDIWTVENIKSLSLLNWANTI